VTCGLVAAGVSAPSKESFASRSENGRVAPRWESSESGICVGELLVVAGQRLTASREAETDVASKHVLAFLPGRA
jgi:hypothetical protein